MIDETVAQISEMQTHSSSAVAVNAARALSELLEREYMSVEEFERDLEQNAGILRRANTSHASLHNVMREIERSVVDKANSVDAAKILTKETIEQVVEDIETGKREAASRAAELFGPDETFLTHDFSSTVLEAVETAAQGGSHITAYVTEARPRFIGRRTARMLAAMDRVETHLCVDSAAGHYLSKCDRVLVGMDCIVNETLHNRVGTFQITTAANELGVPVVVVGSGVKIIDDGFVFENQYRSGSEVMLEPIEEIILENPAYDATPLELVDYVVTDNGIREY